jgi:hypothetical protein
MLDFFEVDLSYLENNYSLFDTFFLGFTYSFAMALPFSPPLLICLRRMVIQGIRIGLSAYLGTAIGYTFFFSLLFFGARDFIQFWYDWEPVFYVIGIALSCKILFAFYNEAPASLVEYDMLDKYGIKSKKTSPFTLGKMISVSSLNFALVLCNPVSLISTSRFILNPNISKLDSPILFLVSFFVGFLCFSSIFGFLFYFLRNYLVSYKNWQNLSFSSDLDQGNETDLIKRSLTFKTFLLRFINPFNQWVVIGSLSLILTSTAKWSWQIFFQYPVENLFTSIQSVSGSLPIDFSKFDGIRNFPDCDTNIQNRDRPGYVFRHFPVDSLIQHRIWEEKQPLTEPQLEDIYFRYRTHRINKLSEIVDLVKFTQRTPLSDRSTPEQIQHLKEVKRNYNELHENNFSPRTSLNKGKGFPNLSYVEEKALSPNGLDNPYLHSSIKEDWPKSKMADLEANYKNRNILDFLS